MGIIVISITAAITDYYYHRIPNLLILLGLTFGLLQVSLAGGYENLLDCLSRMLLVVLLLFLFFACGMLGAGDVKLLGLCPLYMSSRATLEVYALTAAAAAIWAMWLIMRRGDLILRMRRILTFAGACFSCGKLLKYTQESDEELVIPLAVPFLLAVIVIEVFVSRGII